MKSYRLLISQEQQALMAAVLILGQRREAAVAIASVEPKLYDHGRSVEQRAVELTIDEATRIDLIAGLEQREQLFVGFMDRDFPDTHEAPLLASMLKELPEVQGDRPTDELLHGLVL